MVIDQAFGKATTRARTVRLVGPYDLPGRRLHRAVTVARWRRLAMKVAGLCCAHCGVCLLAVNTHMGMRLAFQTNWPHPW